MEYDDQARLDTSEVSDRRGGGLGGLPIGGRGMAVGGGGLGVVGVVIYLIVALVGGGSSAAHGYLDDVGPGQTATSSTLADECRTGADANSRTDCAVVADIQSIQDYWRAALPGLGARYVDAQTVFFSGNTQTGCGTADSGAGPFYCPADRLVYIDLSFYDQLRSQFGAQGGLFVDAYVLAHEYGHHVQDLLGDEARARTSRQGATSGSVRLELQADCYAGVWAHHATTTPDADGRPLVTDITADDVSRALDTAGRIGDDYIETHLGSGRADPSTYTHGTSAQRQRWFSAGYQTGDPRRCDTFSATTL